MIKIEQYSERDTLVAGRADVACSEGRFKGESPDQVTKLLEEELAVFLWTD